jgi:beta-lactam-binding protein with PASTA domain
VVVPNLVGMHLEQAKRTTTSAGLGIAWPAYCDDIVTNQTPAAGAQVSPGSRVSVQLSPPGSC